MKAEKRKKVPSYIYQNSKMTNHNSSSEVINKKIKFKNSNIQDGTRFIDTLSQIDDADEINDGTQLTIPEKPDETSTTSNHELTTMMTMEELNTHIQKCLSMSSENKITPKNAFALKLIDCMNLLWQKEDFSVMACTLDAGQKIYAYRVDGLHQQVIKLAEEVINNQKRKMGTDREDCEGSDEPLMKEKRKVSKRATLAAPESLRRTLKCKDPKERFVKIEGLPGAIMSSVKRDPNDLSFSLQNSVQFWHDWENCKPLTVSGTVTIPQCEIYRNKSETGEKDNYPCFSPTQDKTEAIVNDTMIASAEELSDDFIMDELVCSDMAIEAGESDYNNLVEGEVDVISTALKRMNDEAEENNDICTAPSRFETMKMIFNQASDYHYLNMDKAYYWAGPEFWKRPKNTSLDSKGRKKVTRKKKDPSSISYSGPVVEESISKIMKKGSTLNKKTIMGWKMKNVTYARDLKIGVGQFLDLFNMSEFFEHGEDPQSNEMEMNALESETNCDNFDSLQDNANMDTSDSQDPLNSSFYESAPENCGSPDHGDPLNSAFYDAGLAQKSETTAPETGKIIKVQFSSTHSSDTTLVPAPKMISWQPIKYKTKPIRVDMQHLKLTMWTSINGSADNNDKDAGEKGWENLETSSETKLSDVLRKISPRLEKRTAEDLSPAMALLALLTLANENNLQLNNTEDYSDVVISLENANVAT